MKRVLVALITLSVLAVTASAFAQTWHVSTRLGSRYGSKTTTGSCRVTRQSLLGTATINCGATGGTAVVRYPFTLRAGCGPTVNPTIDFVGTAPDVSTKYADGTVSVGVHRSGAGKTIISLVSISYYCG
jgi:hypothetical protein